MAKKRQREKPSSNTILVEICEDLANFDPSVRLKAVNSLLSNFFTHGKPKPEQIGQIFERLFKGICTHRKQARLGFSLALTECLQITFKPDIERRKGFRDLKDVVNTLRCLTEASHNADGQEPRDRHLGRLFGADAIIESGILFANKAGLLAWVELLDLIFALAKDKPWLRAQCGHVLHRAVNRSYQPPRVSGSAPHKVAQTVIDKLCENGLAKTSEGVSLWVKVQALPELECPKKGIWPQDDPLHPEALHLLVLILKEPRSQAPDSSKDINEKGSWRTTIPYVWEVVLFNLWDEYRYFVDEDTGGEISKRVSFSHLWQTCVDNDLFNPHTSKERNYWGLSLLQKFIPHICTEEEFSWLFTPNSMHCLVDQLSAKTSLLHDASEKVCRAIVTRSEKQCERAPVVKALFSTTNLDLGLDLVLRSKTLAPILVPLVHTDVNIIIGVFEVLLKTLNKDEKALARSPRRKIAELMTTTLRQTLIAKDSLHEHSNVEFAEELLLLLAEYVYLEPQQDRFRAVDSTNIVTCGADTREVVKAQIPPCLVEILTRMEDPAASILLVTQKINKRIFEENVSLRSVIHTDDLLRKLLKDTMNRLSSLHAQSSRGKNQFHRSVILLLCLTYFQVIGGDAEAHEVLEELNAHLSDDNVERYFDRKLPVPAAFVEVLISLVSKPSQLHRQTAQTVFQNCAPLVDSQGLDAMLRVLETPENLTGQNEMFEHDENMESADDTVDVDTFAQDSDVEEFGSDDGEYDLSTSDKSEQGDLASDDDDSEDDEAAEAELAAFDAKLAEALRTRPGQNDLDSEDDISVSSDLSDSKMEALDEQISKVFRERQKVAPISKKKEQREAKENIVQFKCRVLELLDIFVKQRHNDSLALDIIIPVLVLLRQTSSPVVTNKASALVREFGQLCKGAGVGSDQGKSKKKKGKKRQPGTVPNAGEDPHLPTILDANECMPLLNSIHEEAMKGGSNAHAAACSQASLLVVKVLAHFDRKCLRDVVRIYGATQELGLFDAKCQVKTSFFTDWLNWWTSARIQ